MRKVVIVIPTYNEKENIEELIKQIFYEQKKIKEDELNVLVSDSHSNDGTLDIVRRITKKNPHLYLLDVKERGIGVGLLKGYQYAIEKLKAEIVIQIDADLQHNPDDIPRFLAEFNNKVNFVQGSRFIKGGANRLEWYRQVFSWGANLLARFLMGLWSVHEFTTSYRGFTAELFKKIDISKIPWRGKSFIFQPAFLYEAINSGAKIKEIPIVFSDREKGYSKMDIFGYINDLLIYSFKVRINKSSRFLKFIIVGFTCLAINTIILRVLVEDYNFHPVIANLFGAEIAIICNFTLSNLWTFKDRQIKTKSKLLFKFLQFDLASIGSLIISSTIVGLGVYFFGRANYMIYYFMGVATGTIWNYFMYSKVIWKEKSKI